jgi:hypothetical protein
MEPQQNPRKMTKRDLHFFRLDANQAAVIVGLFETVSYNKSIIVMLAFFFSLEITNSLILFMLPLKLDAQ